MFMCTHCLEQYEDSHLSYTMIPESRLSHPAAEMYRLRFCSLAHVQEFLDRIKFQGQRYVLTKVTPQGEKSFEPDVALELLIMVGSSKAS